MELIILTESKLSIDNGMLDVFSEDFKSGECNLEKHREKNKYITLANIYKELPLKNHTPE